MYILGKRKFSDSYHQLDSTQKTKRTSSQPTFSRYSVNISEGIFVRKAKYENPLTPEKRDLIIRKSQEKVGTSKSKEVVINKETGKTPPWEDNLDEKWSELYMLATTAVNLDP
ncbi:hypothetical protein Hanom_Chr04g00308021 [Helianthus anomalus]